jgi:RND family efflux transporter MFP subunit
VGASENTLLTTIVKVNPIHVYFNVNERDLLYYQQNSPLRESPTNGNGETPIYLGLTNQQGYPYAGRIDFVDNKLDPTTGTIQVRGVFPNGEHQIWPGLFARIRVPVGTRQDALLVPELSIGIDQRGEYLLVVNGKNEVEYRPVETGALVQGMRVIETGIAADDKIIVDGLQRARPGLVVNPIQAEAAQASGQEAPAENPK